MTLTLYAVVPARDAASLEGVSTPGGVRLALVREGDLAALVSHAPPPALDAESLRAHDATVRAIAARYDALLPARFGTTAPDEASLARALADRAPEWQPALERVRGFEQMTARIFAADELVREAEADAVSATDGPGARYLRARAALPGLATLREAVRGIARDEIVERFDRPPLVCAVYHLVVRGEADRHRAAALAAFEQGRGGRVRCEVSGPWPPYAFAP